MKVVTINPSEFFKMIQVSLDGLRGLMYPLQQLQLAVNHVYRVRLNAAYQGRYYLPTVGCEAMYDNTISASKAGMWVEVVASEKAI